MSEWSCGWPAPAKINLFLHITGRRDDGLHELQTLFQFLEYGDALAFRLRDDGGIERPIGPASIAARNDLAVRAANLLQEAAGSTQGVDIALTKHIPVGGGLGGGSSDAATALIALNHLWQTGLNQSELAALALQLGADVPVFIGGHAAWAEGAGERLAATEPREPWYLVVAPPVVIATGEVFADPELTRNRAPITIRDFLSHGGGNDCEPVVRRRFPEVGEALDWLAENGTTPRLSGTGACVFGAFVDEDRARIAYANMPPGWRGFVSRGTNRSPLAVRMAALTGREQATGYGSN